MAQEPTLTIVGNLTSDPELRSVKSGKSVCNLTIASTPRYFDKNSGEFADGDTMYMDVTVWAPLADNVADSLRKGMRVIATGTVRQENWETKEGEKRHKLALTADAIGPELRFATCDVTRTTKGASDDDDAPRKRSKTPARKAKAQPKAEPVVEEDEFDDEW